MALSMGTPRPTRPMQVVRGGGNKKQQKSPEELAASLAEVEKSRQEEAKKRLQDEKQRKNELAAAKKLIAKEVRSATNAVRKTGMEVNKMEGKMDRIEKQKETVVNTKNRQASTSEDKITRFSGQRNDVESSLLSKQADLGEARGRLTHAQFAAQMLEKGVIVPIGSDGRVAIAPAYRGMLEDVSVPHDTDAQPGDEVAELSRQNQELRDRLDEMERHLQAAMGQQQGLDSGHDAAHQVTGLIDQNVQLARENQELIQRLEESEHRFSNSRVEEASHASSRLESTMLKMPPPVPRAAQAASLAPWEQVRSATVGFEPPQRVGSAAHVPPYSAVYRAEGAVHVSTVREIPSPNVGMRPVSAHAYGGQPQHHGSPMPPPSPGVMHPGGVQTPGVRAVTPAPFVPAAIAHGAPLTLPPRVLTTMTPNTAHQYHYHQASSPPTFLAPQGMQHVHPTTPREGAVIAQVPSVAGLLAAPPLHQLDRSFRGAVAAPQILGCGGRRQVTEPPWLTHAPATAQQVAANPVTYGAPPAVMGNDVFAHVAAMGSGVEASEGFSVYEPRQQSYPIEPLAASAAAGARTAGGRRAGRLGSVTDDLFNLLDVDHDGVVTRQEFRAGLKKHIIHGGGASSGGASFTAAA